MVDDGFRLIESLAIQNYLAAKYPMPELLPTAPEALAKVRIVQMMTANELFPLVMRLFYESEDSPQFAQAKQEIEKVRQFFMELLYDSSFFGSEQLTLGDIVAGAAVPLR